MPKRFYISDTHFGHKNIAQYKDKNRPFATSDEHDKSLIDAWNKAVSPKDTVYHLGDILSRKNSSLDILKKLNGKKILIMGNHETENIDEYRKYFDDCKAMLVEDDILFSHYPVHPSQLEFKQKFNVHGHMHKKIINDNRYINISAEHINFTPIEHKDLMKIIEQRRQALNKNHGI